MLNANDIWHVWNQHWFDGETSLDAKRVVWFGWHKPFDRYIRKRLLSYTLLASEGGLDDWLHSAEGALALSLLLDRVARKCFRGTCLAFEYDKKARQVSRIALSRQFQHGLKAEQCALLLFPLLASERLEDLLLVEEALTVARGHCEFKGATQEQLSLLDDLSMLAARNRLLITRFRRFPHRAQMLKHGLSAEEQEFVHQYGWQDWL